jgi:UPF0755 protein
VIKRIFAVLLLLVLAAGALVYYAVGVPYQGFEKEVFVDIAPGTPTRGIAQMLASAGVIRADWQFLIARALYPRVTLQAGEYRFDGPMTTLAVFGKIARGDIYFFELRVPEGANIFDIAAEVERIGLAKRDAFLAIARDGTIIHDIAPNAPTLEGFLFPSTYKVTRRTTPQQIVREMTSQFRRIWKEIAKDGEDVNRAVTLASLVEKETAVPAERRTVASVYHNRLEIGMRLDCDPTTIYAALLEGRWDGVIHRSDLDSPNPYNTYRNPGLPPGAIANPGTESLRAALDPAQTKFLFFVAKPDGSGGHVFTETLGEHSTAVQDYRRGNAPR